MPNYDRWLPGSLSFGATKDVTPYPVQLGTTYLDTGLAGHRPGSVTEYDRPKRIAFRQTVLIRRGPLTVNADVRIGWSFEPEEGATRAIRTLDLTIEIPGILNMAAPIVALAFYQENARTLAALKRHVSMPRR